ncbi:alpha-mannosidase [Saccharibacillus sp. CPCC 101409]|uniref:alpha-mannosidase n=1 Tax=Saccharibacillus sp. CPCC 101409 TaxID=3058041 RepID=UPI0026712A99|nr:alpha-mannosidase [Saccharibacillus sp. CPCC 101409]MDO3411895.1 alpha-mannosidase [Saccharibacillus sp. CPCC 101409]
MFMTEAKLEARLIELAALRHRPLLHFDELGVREDEDGEIGAAPPQGDAAGWTTLRIGGRWVGRDRYLWLRLSADLPQAPAGHKLVGLFDFGRTHHGSSRGFESLLFIDGAPRQGVDSNHREVFLDDFAGRRAELRFRLWSGLEGGGPITPQEHVLAQAEIALLHLAADDLYYTARAALETALGLADNRPERHGLLAALNRALNLLDWSRPGSDGFYASAEQALERLSGSLDALRADYPEAADPVTVRCVGHTHIDVAWLWRLRHTREKAARSFSTVLELMEHYPDYLFLQTQPQLYDYVKRDYPELYARIKERVAEGRWEAGGAMWLEADCNLTSGESLVRQILYGTAFFREEFGIENRYLWLPDVFGYSWALPQILRRSGITSFMTTKISWSQYNRMPHDSFIWKGIDGSEILTHFITTPEIEFPQEKYYTYNGYIVPETVQGIWDQYRDKPMNRELLLCYGFGDGGGGVNRDMLEMRRRLERMPGLPKTVTGRADEYFERLERTVKETDAYVHTWDGELYLENHRGTYTSQAWIKKANRKLELTLRRTEMMAAAAEVLQGFDGEKAAAALREVWKIALRNQFHDIIPGSSIAEVYEDAREEYAQAQRLLGEAGPAILDAFSLGGGAMESGGTGGKTAVQTYTLFNDSSRAGTGIVEIPGFDPDASPDADAPDVSATAAESRAWNTAGQPRRPNGIWRGASGEALDAQPTDSGWLVDAGVIPALGFAKLSFEPAAGENRSAPSAGRSNGGPQAGGSGKRQIFVWEPNKLTTPFYEIEWDEQGRLRRLHDREHRREVLAPGESGNVLQVFEDKPIQFDAWNIDLFYTEKTRTVEDLRSLRLTENGPLRASVELEWAYGDSLIRQEVRVYKRSRRIDFVTSIDWRERRQLLKAAFPVDVRATEATYDIQFGSVKRPTHWNTSWDYARFETVGHQWADLSERGYGVSLLNDCKYGYDVKDHTLRLSLIKSAEYPDPGADLGLHEFTYALLPHSGDWTEGGTAAEAWNLNSPPIAWTGEAGLDGQSLLSVSAPHVAVDAIKRAEDGDGFIVRVHECEGRSGEIRFSSCLNIERWRETDLMERPIGESGEGEWSCAIKPFEIRTYRVHFAGRM